MSLVTQEIASVAPHASAVSGLATGLAPRDHVTLSPDAVEAAAAAGDPPRGDVRWYRPRVVVLYRGAVGGSWVSADAAPTDAAGPRRHPGVEAYLRTMRRAA